MSVDFAPTQPFYLGCLQLWLPWLRTFQLVPDQSASALTKAWGFESEYLCFTACLQSLLHEGVIFERSV